MELLDAYSFQSSVWMKEHEGTTSDKISVQSWNTVE